MHRSKRKRNLIIFSLVGVLLCMAIGYAAFQTQLKVTGSSTVTSNWDIEITNVTAGTPTGSAENAVAPSYDKLWASMEANLYDKGDAMEYDVTIENKGTLDAKLNDIITNLDNSNNEAVLITFSGYTKGEVLKAQTSKVVHVKIEYNPEYEGGETSSEVEINFDYGQNNNETNNPDNTYLVKYDCTTNGGEDCTNNNEYFSTGNNVDLNKTGYKKDFTFIGWNTNKDAQEKLDSLIMENNDITLYAIFKDTTPPICTLKVKEATINTVTIEATCEDVSGISKYEYSINNNGYIDNNNNKTYTFASFDLSTIKLKATDGAGNSAEFTLTEEELQNGYQIIYDVLNKEYEDALDKKEKYEKEFLNKTYPIGSIYISTSSTNPSSLFGGTWAAYAQGRTLIGVGSNGETNYASAGLTGGTENVTLATTNIPSHSHTVTPVGTVKSTFSGRSGTTSSSGTHTHSGEYVDTKTSPAADNNLGLAQVAGFKDRVIVSGRSMTAPSSGAHTHTYTASGTVSSRFTGSSTTSSSAGSTTSFNVMNPYIVTYIWKRTG